MSIMRGDDVGEHIVGVKVTTEIPVVVELDDGEFRGLLCADYEVEQRIDESGAVRRYYVIPCEEIDDALDEANVEAQTNDAIDKAEADSKDDAGWIDAVNW